MAVDSATQSDEEIITHKTGQEQGLTKHLTGQHSKKLVADVWELRKQLETTPLQLYVQSCAMSDLVYNTLFHADIYYSFRLPKELGEYHWVIDAKDRDKITPWEDWWSKVVLPMIEARSFVEPMIEAEGGDYRWHDKFKVELDDYRRQFIPKPELGQYFDLKPKLQNDVRFSSLPEYGLEAVDILVNAVRRSLAGNSNREGWLPVRKLMVHRKQHYISLISLAPETTQQPKVPYTKVLADFSSGGRSMLPPKY